MKQQHKRNLILAATLALGAGMASAASLTTFSGYVFNVSGDGLWAVHNQGANVGLYSTASGISKTIAGGMGTTDGESGSSTELSISRDGRYVLAGVRDAARAGTVASVYDRSTGNWSPVGDFGTVSYGQASVGYDISGDGRYVGGAASKRVSNGSNLVDTFHAFVADRNTGSFINLTPTLAANQNSRVNGVSDDGGVVVGFTTNGARLGTIWTRQGDGSYTAMAPHLANGSTGLRDLGAVSDNGRWAAGGSTLSTDPYYVDTSTGLATTFAKLPLVDPFGGQSIAYPAAISADGKTIVGTHQIGTQTFSSNHGFIWTAAGGTQDFDTYLAGYGVDLSNQYNFLSVLSISDDGMTYTGIAMNNVSGAPLGFVVTVPEPSSYAMLGAGLGLVGWLARRRNQQDQQDA